MNAVYVGIGSNIEPRKYIPQALDLLQQAFGELVVSPIYACPAVGFEGDPFLNLVVGMRSEAEPHTIMRALRDIENTCGRSREAASDATATRARTMDLDFLLYGDTVMQTADFTLPRDDILRYAFVLKPLADIAGDQRHPVTGQTYAELWQAFDATEQPLREVKI